jgi:preprotein translocase subunit YajC
VPPFSLIAQQAEDPYGFMRMMVVIVPIMFFFYFLFIRPQRKKEEDMRRMVSNLKENDRVVTIGGIHGTVTNVRRDVDLVTIRIDESTGAKIRVGTTAIARVLTEEKDEAEKPAGKPNK